VLQRIYANTFKIFFDAFGGDQFGIVWDPSLKTPRPFRVLGEFSSMPVKKVDFLLIKFTVRLISYDAGEWGGKRQESRRTE
jgi:hypothetical protein